MTTVKRAPAAAKTAKKVAAPAPSANLAAKVPVPGAKAAPSMPKPVAPEPAKAVPKPEIAKPDKPKKPKLVRDSFTIPKTEYAVLDDLKQRAARLSSLAKKSELLRAGIKALAAMPDAAFLGALRAVPAIKTGRPSKT